jgi:hypothetical protein
MGACGGLILRGEAAVGASLGSGWQFWYLCAVCRIVPQNVPQLFHVEQFGLGGERRKLSSKFVGTALL